MPAATGGARVTFFFGLDNATWTESFYLTNVSSYLALIGGVGVPTPLFQGIINARVAMLATPCSMIGVRVSLLNEPRTSQIVDASYIPATVAYTTPGSEQLTADRPYSTVLVIMYGDNDAVKRTYMGGVPDGDIGEGTGYHRGFQATTAWRAKLDDYMLRLIGASAGFRSESWAAAQTVQNVLTNGPADAPVGIEVPAQIVFGIQPPQIALRGFRRLNPRLPGMGRIHRVHLPLPTAPGTDGLWQYYLRGVDPAAGSNQQQLGQAAPQAYIYPIIQQAVVDEATHRKRGVSALASRGRSRTRT